MSELSDLVKMLKNKKESGSDYIGIVSRVSGDTAYVQMTGSDIMDTPVAMTVDCKPGDRVRIRVNSGKAWITGNDTAPPTNDTKSINKLTQKANDNDKRVNRMQKAVDETAGVAANTNQHFWMTEEGSDTGAHITEIPRKQFIADPEHGGGNLLARSNGIAIRDGLTDLATMTADNGIQIGKSDGFRVIINQDSIEMIDDSGVTGFRISLDGNETQRTVSNTHNLNSRTKPTIDFTAPIEDYTISFKATINSTAYTATKTSAQLAVGDSFYLGPSGTRVRIARTGTTSFRATAIASGAVAMPLVVSYTVSMELSKINFTGGNNLLWSGGYYMSADQTANLSENVSEQLSGIVLAWSAYANGAVQNYDWHYQFVPKDHVIARNGHGISTGIMSNAAGSFVGVKYVYVADDHITGYAGNSTSQTGSGISFQNAHWVLRYVLGV